MTNIDREIAEKVMSWKYIQHEAKPYTEVDEDTGEKMELWFHFNPFYARPDMGNLSTDIWVPSTNIAQAMEVIDKLVELGIKKISISYNAYLNPSDGNWICDLEKQNIITRARTKEMAICKAALKAVGSQK